VGRKKVIFDGFRINTPGMSEYAGLFVQIQRKGNLFERHGVGKLVTMGITVDTKEVFVYSEFVIQFALVVLSHSHERLVHARQAKSGIVNTGVHDLLVVLYEFGKTFVPFQSSDEHGSNVLGSVRGNDYRRIDDVYFVGQSYRKDSVVDEIDSEHVFDEVVVKSHQIRHVFLQNINVRREFVFLEKIDPEINVRKHAKLVVVFDYDLFGDGIFSPPRILQNDFSGGGDVLVDPFEEFFPSVQRNVEDGGLATRRKPRVSLLLICTLDELFYECFEVAAGISGF
jgi:hypothetical protein